VGAGILIIFGTHLGQAIANLVAGSDWSFSNRVDLFSSPLRVLRAGTPQ
jgi:hypothetical protein